MKTSHYLPVLLGPLQEWMPSIDLGGGEGVRKTRAMVFGGGLTDSKRPLQGLKYKVSIKVQIGDDEHTAVWS